MSGLPGGLFGEAVFQVADDLFYPVPEGYRNNPELMLVQNGHVMPGAVLKPANHLYDGSTQPPIRSALKRTSSRRKRLNW